MLHQQQDKVFIATGRSLCLIPQSIKDGPFDGFISSNGAEIHYNNEVLYRHCFSSDLLLRIKEYCVENNMMYFYETSDKIYLHDFEDKRLSNFIGDWGMDKSTVELLTNFDDKNITMIMIKADTVEQLKAFSDHFSEVNVQQHINSISADVCLKTESKGRAITILCEKLTIDINNTIAFGDGNNDLEMLQTVNLGIAMGNAVEPLKAVADDVTDTIENDGIYNALIKHNIIKP